MANSAAITAAERSMRSVFVGNIPYEATEEQLKDIFSEVGPVVSFRLVYDRETGKPKGYGFCEYKDIETAASAMRNLNAHELNGRALRVDNAASEKSREEMSLAALGGPPVESPYGPEVEPEKAPEAISKAVASLPPEQMFELMKQMKLCVQNNPSEARTMLLQNPQLAYALLQAQIIMKIVDPKVAMSILHRQNPASNQAQPSQQPEMDTTPAPAPVQPPIPSTMGLNQPQASFGPPHVPEHPPQHYEGARMRPPMPQQPGQLVDRPQQVPPGVPYGPPRGPDRVPGFDPSRMGDRDMRQMDRDMRQMDRDMRMQPMIGDRDMRQQPMGDQDMRYMPRPDPRFPPSSFDPRMGPRPPSVNFPPPRPYEGAPPRPMNQPMGSVPGPQPMGPRPQPQPGPRMMNQPQPAGQSPGQTPPGPAPPRPPAAAAAPPSALPSTQDQEKAALIMQVLQLSDQQIAMLPPEQRQSIMILKEQIARNSQNP